MKTLQKQTFLFGEEKSTSSQGDSLANRSVSQECEKERKITATSGHRCYGQFGRLSPLGSLARTLLESSRWYSPVRRLRWDAVPLSSTRITYTERSNSTSSRPSAKTLSVRDILSSRLLFRLVPSEHPTGETACGLLPTVQTQGLKRCNAEGKTEFMPLDLLPTPTAIDSGSGRMNKSPSLGAKERPTIALAAKMGLIPTPMSTDIHHAEMVEELKQSGKSGLRCREKGKSGANGLTDFQDFNGLLLTQSASDGMRANFTMESLIRYNKPNAERSNLSEQIAHKVGGGASQLNPLFVEEMMVFPLMWTSLPFLSPNGDENP